MRDGFLPHHAKASRTGCAPTASRKRFSACGRGFSPDAFSRPKKSPREEGTRNHHRGRMWIGKAAGRVAWTDHNGCQSGSGSTCPAPGARPCAPGGRLPSTAWKRGGPGLCMVRTSMQAKNQAEQQGAQRQGEPQGFEAAQFGVRVMCGGFDFRHGRAPGGVLASNLPPRRWRRQHRADLPLACGKTRAVVLHGLRIGGSHSTLRTSLKGAGTPWAATLRLSKTNR